MDYSFYLFSKLYDLHTQDERPYDEIFVDLCKLYEEFRHSEYNDYTKPTYECIVRFLIKDK